MIMMAMHARSKKSTNWPGFASQFVLNNTAAHLKLYLFIYQKSFWNSQIKRIVFKDLVEK